jgi:hypothetical protein
MAASLARRLRFRTVAASRNSSLAPESPLSLSRVRPRLHFGSPKRASIFLRSHLDWRHGSVPFRARARSRAEFCRGDRYRHRARCRRRSPGVKSFRAKLIEQTLLPPHLLTHHDPDPRRKTRVKESHRESHFNGSSLTPSAKCRRNRPPSIAAVFPPKAGVDQWRIWPVCESRHSTTAFPSETGVLCPLSLRRKMTHSWPEPSYQLLHINRSWRAIRLPSHMPKEISRRAPA